MAIHRVTTVWGGFQGAPGYSNFFFTGDGSGGQAEESRSRVVGLWNAINTELPNDVTLRTDPEVAVIDEATGMTTGFITIDTPATPSTGGDSTGYSAASGAVINWLTAGVRNGRRVRGRTFIVPLGGGAYQSDGTLTADALDALQAGAESIIGDAFDSGFGVWSRPANGSGGLFFEANGHRILDRVSVLRSRRD